MVKARLIRTFVLAFVFALLVSSAETLEQPHAPPPAGNDRAAEFWAADVAGLYQTSQTEVVYERSGRDGCRVEEFWTRDVSGLYRMTSADVLMPGTEHAIRLIEFSIASAEEEESPD